VRYWPSGIDLAMAVALISAGTWLVYAILGW
jgi:hypothetical protein